MEFPADKLNDLRQKLKDKTNLTDDYISRGVRLTATGNAWVAREYQIDINEVPAMLAAVSQMVAGDLKEDSERFSYEADYMGNLTLRDAESGKDIFLQGDEAFELAGKLESHPGVEQRLIAPYFGGETLNESEVEAASVAPDDAGTFNFPYKDGLASARFWIEDGDRKVKAVSFRKNDTHMEVDITPDLQNKLDTVAMKWWDKV